MAYKQKNDPFLNKATSSLNRSVRSPMLSRDEPVEPEAGVKDTDPTKEPTEAEKSRARVARKIAIEKEIRETRVGMGESLKTRNTRSKNVEFIKITDKVAPNALDGIMSMGDEDIDSLQQDIKDTAEPFIGLRNAELSEIATKVGDLDLSKFKTHLEKANISVDDLSKIIGAQVDNLPDLNNDGTPDMFEGVDGRLMRFGVDKLIAYKLRSLK